MAIEFPIFLQDTDGWMYRLEAVSGLENLELIDIEEQEYHAWDVNGRRLELYADARQIAIRAVGEGSHPDELRAALLRYARLVRPETATALDASHPSATELFAAIEKGQRN